MKSRNPFVLTFLIAALVAIVVCSFHNYRELNRPGVRWENAGIDALSQHNAAIAKTDWIRGTVADPSYAGNFERLGDLGLSLGDKEQSAKFFNKTVYLAPENTDADIKACRADLAVGDFPSAEAAARDAIKNGHDTADAEEYLGVAAEEQRNSLVSLPALKKAHDLAPTNNDYLIGYTSVLIDLDKTDEAEPLIRGYLTNNPEDAHANYMLSVILSKKSPTPQTLQEMVRYGTIAVDRDQTKPEYWNLLADTYLRLGKPVQAKAAYWRAYRIDRTSEAALQGLVTTLAATRDLKGADKASSVLIKVITLHHAIDDLQLKNEADPHDVVSGIKLGNLKELDQKPMAAQKVYTSLLENNPSDQRARAALEGFFARTGHPDLAVAAKNYNPSNNQ